GEVAGPPGAFDDQFVLDIFQTGSGTSTNPNANEVIANRAGELLGGEFGSRLVHPNDDVNREQSSNDVIPTAMHLAALAEVQEVLIPAVERLRQVLEQKSKEFWPVIKTGRTHLQDATPIRLGQEFLGYAGQMERSVRRLNQASQELQEVALGGNAVGTGINMHPEFPRRVCDVINERTGLGVRDGVRQRRHHRYCRPVWQLRAKCDAADSYAQPAPLHPLSRDGDAQLRRHACSWSEGHLARARHRRIWADARHGARA